MVLSRELDLSGGFEDPFLGASLRLPRGLIGIIVFVTFVKPVSTAAVQSPTLRFVIVPLVPLVSARTSYHQPGPPVSSSFVARCVATRPYTLARNHWILVPGLGRLAYSFRHPYHSRARRR